MILLRFDDSWWACDNFQSHNNMMNEAETVAGCASYVIHAYGTFVAWAIFSKHRTLCFWAHCVSVELKMCAPSVKRQQTVEKLDFQQRHHSVLSSLFCMPLTKHSVLYPVRFCEWNIVNAVCTNEPAVSAIHYALSQSIIITEQYTCSH